MDLKEEMLERARKYLNEMPTAFVSRYTLAAFALRERAAEAEYHDTWMTRRGVRAAELNAMADDMEGTDD